MIYTIGHSTRSQQELIDLLKAHGSVSLLADIRTIPRSRTNPQFNKEELSAAMPRAGIEYVHLKELGGLRKPRKDSTNTGWKNESFRGYADYMQTPGFEQSLDELTRLAETRDVAIMCAEAVPWRCHRSLVADALVARGIEVRDILSAKRADPHRLTSFARIDREGRVTYPAVPADH